MKHATDTSRAAFKDVRADLARRQMLILDGIRRYWREHFTDPTSYELLRFLQVDHPALDLNGIRPRLTELDAAGRVAKGDKRRCTITAKTVYTWATVTPSPLPIPSFEHVVSTGIAAARQMGLL